ncbi:hypothetical protein SELMODRAFT_443196 [Selaginella moellendorffii]|uniref:Chloride channel protein n=1 Tax=Selaginella moellendorffii TaxID=88036 RepID=D8RZE2_SELML|nr:hypothetical protein SELMODRAFT_443196 [Selaginella moellendorffii]
MAEEEEEEIRAPLLTGESDASSWDPEALDPSPPGAAAAAATALPETLNNELGIESLDYDPVFSVVHAKTTTIKQNRRLYGYTGATLAKWSITICIGVLVGMCVDESNAIPQLAMISGLIAYVIESSQEFLVTEKKSFAQKTVEGSLILSFLGFAGFSVLLILISSCLVLFWAPPAAGGGVTLVMAYLNGNDIPDFFKLSTLITKVGQEAPMVHIGAAIASAMTWMHGSLPSDKDASTKSSRSCWNAKATNFDFYNDKDRREFISAGAAAGLAAAFGAPIGGVLYSLEEASSFWSKKVMWRSLLCCTCATMVLASINEWQFSMALPGSMAFRQLKPGFRIRDLPLFAVTSVFAGVLGAFVNIVHDRVDRLRPAATRKFSRLLEVCGITVISVAVMYLLPLALGSCLQVPEGPLPDGKMDEKYWLRYKCSKGEYNDLATLLFSLPRKSMQQLYNMQGVKHQFPTADLAIHTGSVLFLFIIAYGTATPGGIFMPSMLAGASFGACMGTIFQAIFPGENIQPGLHAIVGSTAMLGGVFRASISLVVIMVEGTGGIDFILPIIVAIVVSNWVAHHIYHAGAYEADLERLGGVYFMHSEPPHQLAALTASDIMSPNVICFQEVVPVREVLEVLRNTRHNGFPVLRHTSAENSGAGEKFVGLVLRHQLLLLLEEGLFSEVDSSRQQHRFSLYEKPIPKQMLILEHSMRAYHHYHHPHRRFLSSRPPEVARIEAELARKRNLAEADMAPDKKTKKVVALDLRPFMNRAPLTVRRECSAQRVYVIFRTLGLRHLCVTDSHNRVIGIITRKDIAMAQKQGFQKKSLQHWDSDIRSLVAEASTSETSKNRNKLFNLP